MYGCCNGSLAMKKFTNGKQDHPRVAQLYRQSFWNLLGTTAVLSFTHVGWGDEEAKQVATVLASGALRALTSLLLSANDIGDQGMRALATAIEDADLPQLTRVDVADKPRASAEAAAAVQAAVTAQIWRLQSAHIRAAA